MEKDAAAHRRHRPGPGVPASGLAPGHLKAASEMAELQRSRSMGGLHQKGDPPSCIKKLSKEPESEDQGKDPRTDTEDAGGQADPEEDTQEKHQDSRGKLDPDGGRTEPEVKRSRLEARGQGGRAGQARAREQEPESVKVDDRRGKETPSVFVEIDLGDCAEEVVTGAMREEKRSQMDMGDLSEDETRTSWVCCIPYSTRRKAKESVVAPSSPVPGLVPPLALQGALQTPRGTESVRGTRSSVEGTGSITLRSDLRRLHPRAQGAAGITFRAPRESRDSGGDSRQQVLALRQAQEAVQSVLRI
ncbi:uncharacterized protein C13orf46 homolog [Neovison vison]|uniref:uncharacterized protein C13orf46 homolog n=1 Tax=Neovison vison TaxID=452646 RepID=UPI001CF087C7|nr:uncharacterized protein C13orf46 homolog [Neogale vison]